MPNNWTPSATKLSVYEALYSLNRTFEATLMALARLEDLEFFRRSYLDALKTRMEYLRSESNEELVSRLQELEQEDSTRLDQLQRDWEKRHRDPDDVFYAAAERKQEVNDQIKELQASLHRQRPRHKTRSKRK